MGMMLSFLTPFLASFAPPLLACLLAYTLLFFTTSFLCLLSRNLIFLLPAFSPSLNIIEATQFQLLTLPLFVLSSPLLSSPCANSLHFSSSRGVEDSIIFDWRIEMFSLSSNGKSEMILSSTPLEEEK